MNMAGKTLIHLENVTKVFYTDEVETHALSGIHLDISEGEYAARWPDRRDAANRRCSRSSACSTPRPTAFTS